MLLVLLTWLVSTLQPAGTLTFTAPDGWKPRPASNGMRVAEFVLPKAAGDTEDAELIVYYFGGQGGDVEANITRWIGQLQQPDGRTSADAAKRSTRTVNGLNLALLDVAGTYVAETSPGSTERLNKPGFRLLAAVVPTPRGPHFIKLLGPARSVEKWAASYESFLQSLKFVGR